MRISDWSSDVCSSDLPRDTGRNPQDRELRARCRAVRRPHHAEAEARTSPADGMPQREGETPVPLFFGPVPPRLDAPTARRRDRHRLGQAPDREGWRARSGVPDHGAEVRKTEARARGQLLSADIYSAQDALLVRLIDRKSTTRLGKECVSTCRSWRMPV